jgi:ribosomal protein S21
MKKKANVVVHAKHCRNNPSIMIRRFIKKCKKERIIEEVRERRYYKKPSVAKKEKRKRAERARLRDEQKRQRAQERRTRKNK